MANNQDQALYLSFHISGEEYAIGILRAKEIIEFGTVTKIPTTPPHVRGVINLRGNVVPVIDLAVKMGLPESPVTKLSCIVIVEVTLEGEPVVMGIMADSVSEVIELSAGDIEPTPAFGTRIRVDYLQGMAKAGQKFILLLDIDQVLTAEDLIAAVQFDDPAPAEGLQQASAEA